VKKSKDEVNLANEKAQQLEKEVEVAKRFRDESEKAEVSDKKTNQDTKVEIKKAENENQEVKENTEKLDSNATEVAKPGIDITEKEDKNVNVGVETKENIENVNK